jgi:hypothetical protein
MSDLPYRECKKCQSITDCKNLEIEQDGMGTILVPDDCPKKDKNGKYKRTADKA